MMVQQQQQAQMFSQMMNVNAMSMGGKKQRELYVGNLAIGMVTEQMLRDFFNTALKGLVPEEAHTPAVMNVWMAADMKYSFVEMRTEHLATSSIALDKVELCGRSLNVGRPSGYVPSPVGAMPAAANPMAGAMAAMQAAMGTGGMHMTSAAMATATNPSESKVVILENMLTEEDVAGDEYEDIVEDIKEECTKHGSVDKVCIPRPGNPGVGKAFVKFATVAAATKAMDALSGRTFDGRKVVVNYMPEADFDSSKFS